jgi:phytoene dehydrogenase-like protein
VPSYGRRSFDEIDTDPEFYANELLMVSIPTLFDPALAPAGRSVVILQCAASIRSFDAWGTIDGQRTERYQALKKQVAARLIANAEKLIPGLSAKIEVQVESTPFTLKRFTLNANGAATGWTYHPREAYRGGLRGLMTKSNTGVENLYQVGHWTMSPGGAPAGLITGRLVSSTIRRRFRSGKS